MSHQPQVIKLGHYYPHIMAVVVPLVWALMPVLVLFQVAPPWLMTATMLCAAAAVMMGVALLADWVHARNICEMDSLNIPADPAAEVDRHRWKLRFHHRRILPLVYCLLIVGSSMFKASTDSAFGWRLTCAALGIVTGVGTVWLFVIPGMVHRRLTLWCPWCRRRRRGEDDVVFQPTPDPVGEQR